MRDLLERHVSARIAVVVVSASVVFALARVADARDRLDMMEAFRRPESPRPADPAPAAAVPRVPVARIAAKPLRIALRRLPEERRGAERRKPVARIASRRRVAPALPVAALPPARAALFEPLPQKPAIVSIYNDQTLRRGDAVVMTGGLRIFSGREVGPHLAADFVPLSRTAAMGWHLRRTLSAFEYNPPDRWRT